MVLECTQTHTPKNQYQRGPICFWVVWEVTESQLGAQQAALFSLWPFPHRQCPHGLPCPGEYLRLCSLKHTRLLRQKHMAQMKEQIRGPNIELSDEEIANLSDAQFKTLVIKKLTELVERMKAMLRETKENVQGTNSDGKETGTQINGVDQKEERNIQPEQNEETRIRKNEERLRNVQDILKRSNIHIIGVLQGEEEEQEIENLFEQIMKENFPHLAKEIDFQEVQEAERAQRSWTQGGTHQGTS